MKYSLIIVAYKAPESLCRCLQSLAANPPENSDREAEIVIWDNSPEPIEAHVNNALLLELCQKYIRVGFYRDGQNLGFAAGCNKAVTFSHGKNLVFINPDTMVFKGWAEGLMGHMRPEVGAIGPISDFVAGLQKHEYHMQRYEDPAKAAEVAAKGNAGRGVDTKLLIGFFLLMRREVWNKIGGMDPQFFLGCDDLDLSLRLREAGYQLIIASDVFVYHEGHASFYAMGEESMRLTKQAEKKMLAKLKAKYGDPIPSSTELWGCEILPTMKQERMTLSVCMIVKNEMDNLMVLLEQLKFADEIIIVDTGSDRIHLEWINNRVFLDGDQWNSKRKLFSWSFLWEDDFSKARNFALSKCTGDYVLWLDADDRVPMESAALIRAAFDFPGPLTAQKKCHFALRLRDHLPTGKLGYCDQPRIFPRVPGLEWEERVHENYMAKADALGLQLVTTGILIDHHGYEDAERLKGKHERNIRLLQMEENSPMKFYQLGKSFQGLRQFDRARRDYRFVLEHDWKAKLDAGFVAQVRYLIALSFYQEKENADPQMDEWLQDNPKPDALFLRAERALFEKDFEAAETMYREYANYGEIMDYFGTDRDTFQPAALERIQMIEKAVANA
jgi:GT2 family glycosyltransferase